MPFAVNVLAIFSAACDEARIVHLIVDRAIGLRCKYGSDTLRFYIQCASVEEYIVAALATKPHRQMAAISAKTVGTSSLASHIMSLFLSIRHPSRRREQMNALTEGYRLQAKGAQWPAIKV